MKRILLFFCLILVGFLEPKQLEQQQETFILFFNVAYRPKEDIIEEHVRKSLGLFKSIGLLFSGIPTKEEVKRQLFTTLDKIPLADISISPDTWQTSSVPWDIDYAYPPILNQIITSSTLEQEKIIYKKVVQAINRNSRLNKSRKIILKCIADFLFQSEWMNKVMQPVPEMIQLVEELQKNGHRVILVAGVPGHAWDTFLAYYPASASIKKYFSSDTIYVSGKKNLLPTSPALYDLILKEHNLDPADCCVIAHNHHDLMYPKELGMKTFIYNLKNKNFVTFRQNLLNSLSI